MQRPNCPCWDCDNRTPTCKSGCELFTQYEADYKMFEKQRQDEWNKKDASIYKSSRREKFYRNLLLEKKKGKKI